MIDTLNMLIGPVLLILMGLLLVGVFKRIAGPDREDKRTGLKFILWGGSGIVLLVIIIAVTNLFITPSGSPELPELPNTTASQ